MHHLYTIYMVKIKDRYIIPGLVVLAVILLVVTVVSSPGVGTSGSTQTSSVDCAAVNLSFSYLTNDSIYAPLGTNTFGRILVNSTGSVNSTMSLTVSAPSSLDVSTANDFNMSAGKSGYFTEYEVVNPSAIGNYTLNVTLANSAMGCQNTKSFLVNVHTISSQNSTNSSV